MKRKATQHDVTVFDTFKVNVPAYFCLMLCDQERNRLYEAAIDSVVKKFIVKEGRPPRVLDVGAGTGLLSIYAARAGAASVVGLEANAARAKLARKNILTHNQSHICSIEACISTNYQLPLFSEPFDILICELLGTLIHYERMNHFIGNLLLRKIVRTFDNGRNYIVPQHINMWMQPYRRRLNDSSPSGLQFVDSAIEYEKCNIDHSTMLGMVPHEKHFEAVGSRTAIIDQPSWTPLKLKNIKGTLPQSQVALFCFFEWQCQLWDNYVLQHTLPAISTLSADNYYARMLQWGFYVFVSQPSQQLFGAAKKRKVTREKYCFTLTEDSLLIE